jgi:pimeloyl-ACP methyl ester carboxylesterase
MAFQKHKYVDIGDIKFLVLTPKAVGVKVDEIKRIYWKQGDGRKLIILLHGSTIDSNAKKYCHICNIINQELPDYDVLIPDLPAGLFSTASCLIIVRDLLRLIDKFEEENEYKRIILIGHSFGAIMARKAYICACGETEKAPLETSLLEFAPGKTWAKKVTRIILLAGTNRGWHISHHLSPFLVLAQSVGVFLGNVMTLFGCKPLIFNIRRGAPFITQLRIQWLAMCQDTAKRDVNKALTIQLLGSIDDIVSPEDNIDLVTGKDFIYLDVPKTGHSNIIVMDESPEGQKRKDKFKLALTGKPNDLRKNQVFLDEDQILEPKLNVEQVVFVIHGIRDRGYWTKKIARKVRALGGNKIYATETSTYGYFPMLSFLFPFRRRDKVEWLMDQYTENLGRYPHAIDNFHYVGHSNGTYLLAKAIEEYPCCRFKNVVFAGSVVPIDYDWFTVIKRRQVAKVLNFVATKDWVVAFFPKLFQVFPFLRWQGLGSAGFDGFKLFKDLPLPHQYLVKTPIKDGDNEIGEVFQVEYIQGAHGAALVEDNWETIAQFIVSGDVADSQLLNQKSLLSKKQAVLISVLSKVPYLVWGLILVVVIWLGWVILSLNIAEWQKTVAFILYLWSLWSMLTRM